jgi:hypothetical protein
MRSFQKTKIGAMSADYRERKMTELEELITQLSVKHQEAEKEPGL